MIKSQEPLPDQTRRPEPTAEGDSRSSQWAPTVVGSLLLLIVIIGASAAAYALTRSPLPEPSPDVVPANGAAVVQP